MLLSVIGCLVKITRIVCTRSRQKSAARHPLFHSLRHGKF